MKDDMRQPSQFDSLPHSEQDRIRAIRDLGSFVARAYKLSLASVDDELFLGSLNKTSSDEQAAVLFASNFASSEEKGYLYLRGFSSLVLGHLDEIDDISIPYPDKSRYRQFSLLEKMMSLEAISAAQHILTDQPASSWDDNLREHLSKAGAEQRFTNEGRVSQLIILLHQPRFQVLISDWQRLAESDMALLQASLMEIALPPRY